ncbi:Glycosyltransferase [Labilithrix luteola]|uniref:Glycosyltransferase n=1 Tax=Labilithrix luteola TaxID=1391654 RepID=A0A0K1QCP9_9BACT|nr:Glycosyltransferase [Labilithrix luteola]
MLLLLAMYGLHRSHLVLTVLRYRDKLRSLRDGVPPLTTDVDPESLPHVTIQLPLFNEATVLARLLEHTARIAYPRSKLEIQVLDDSTDESRQMARSKVAALADESPAFPENMRKDWGGDLDIVYLHRVDRTGYKAGALDAGLKVAKGELIAIFDADFLPGETFLLDLVPHFMSDPKIGMVQARWGHMNRELSWLTRVQALMLDGHHLVENRARAAAGWLFNFSGTGGMWRKAAIDSSGGWQHDTLTEDLDLSYRAQMAGWKFAYRENVVTPAELPEDVSAFRAQQYRWAKGTVQTARKLMKRVMTTRELTLMQRIEAFFHMTPHFAYPLMVVLSVLLLPALLMMPATNPTTMLIIDLPLCIGTTGSLMAFYAMAEAAQGRRRMDAVRTLPGLLALGAGLAPHLSKAVFEGLRSMAGEFIRTPKHGSNHSNRYRARADLPTTEIGLCLVSFGSVVASIETGHWFATPFAMLFMIGYGYVALLVASEQFARRKAVRLAPASAAQELESIPPPAPSTEELAA